MTGELQNKVRDIIIDKNTSEEMLNVIGTAGQEFPCLTCPSKEECKTFNWFIIWFGENKSYKINQ